MVFSLLTVNVFLLRKIALPYPHKCLLGFVEAKRGDQQDLLHGQMRVTELKSAKIHVNIMAAIFKNAVYLQNHVYLSFSGGYILPQMHPWSSIYM